MNWRYDVRVSARPRLLVRQGSVMPPFLLSQSQSYGGIMNSNIPINSGNLAGESVQTVNARDLHAFLEVGKDFSTWIKERISEYGFVKEADFTAVTGLSSPKSGSSKARNQRTIDYHLSLDMAKELAMVEKTAKGREARRYFIECERRAKAAVAAPLPSPSESHPAESSLLILEGELVRIRANADFFKDMSEVLNTLAFTRGADGFSSSMAGALRTVATRSGDLLWQVAENVAQVRARTLAAVKAAQAKGQGNPADAAARSAKAAKAARVRWDRERDRKAPRSEA